MLEALGVTNSISSFETIINGQTVLNSNQTVFIIGICTKEKEAKEMHNIKDKDKEAKEAALVSLLSPPPEVVVKLQQFVWEGGQLITFNGAIQLYKQAFPGTVEPSDQITLQRLPTRIIVDNVQPEDLLLFAGYNPEPVQVEFTWKKKSTKPKQREDLKRKENRKRIPNLHSHEDSDEEDENDNKISNTYSIYNTYKGRKDNTNKTKVCEGDIGCFCVLEKSSQLIKIINPSEQNGENENESLRQKTGNDHGTGKVQVLLRARVLTKKLGNDAAIVKFTHGRGTVYHLISPLLRKKKQHQNLEKGYAQYLANWGAFETTYLAWRYASSMGFAHTFPLADSAAPFIELLANLILRHNHIPETGVPLPAPPHLVQQQQQAGQNISGGGGFGLSGPFSQTPHVGTTTPSPSYPAPVTPGYMGHPLQTPQNPNFSMQPSPQQQQQQQQPAQNIQYPPTNATAPP